MIFPKKTIIVFATSTIAIVLLYIARVPLLKTFATAELANYQAKITCLDFHINRDWQLVIKHLCLQTPQVDINIEQMTISLQLGAKEKIKAINISTMTIKGSAELFSDLGNQQQAQQASATEQLQSYLTSIAQLNLPFDIRISTLRYLPYLATNERKDNQDASAKRQYFASFSALNNNLALSLKDSQQNTFLTAKLARKNTGQNKLNDQAQFSLELTSEIKPLQHFLMAHNLPLPSEITAALTTIKSSGKFHSLVNYQAGQLTLDSQLKDFKLTAAEGIKTSGPFQLYAALDIYAEINLAQDKQRTSNARQFFAQFQPNNILTLEYKPQSLVDYLNNNAVSPALITLIKDNPLTQLTFRPNGALVYKTNNQHLSLTGLEIKAEADAKTRPILPTPLHQLSIDNIVLNLNHYLTASLTPSPSDNNKIKAKNVKFSDKPISKKNRNSNNLDHIQQTEGAILAQFDFSLDSPLMLSALKDFTHSPLLLKLQGSLQQNQAKTIIHFTENSTITSANIAISSKQKTGNKKLVSIKQIQTKLFGDVQIENSSQGQDYPDIQVNLQNHSQAKNLRAENLIQLNTLALNSTILGSLTQFDIKATASADNVALGNLALNGSLAKANITLTANELPLIELLALNLKLPTEINLVEGALSYNLSGQVTDFSDINNTPFSVSAAITSLSGEVAGIWIKSLNWRQNFDYLAGELSTREDETENLSVELIETATPISKLSISTSWHYQKDFKMSATKLQGDILGGSFTIPKIQWPSELGHSVEVQLSSIDLEQVLALDKKQGIVVTGKISGQLPLSYDGEKYIIKQGQLHNVSDGLIQVINNPAVERLKADNKQLQLAFGALQNLHYHQLSSDVSMTDDGYMLLETVIKGRNPDIDNDVNLNLNVSYDLLGLLESISITERFEEKIIKGLQKH